MVHSLHFALITTNAENASLGCLIPVLLLGSCHLLLVILVPGHLTLRQSLSEGSFEKQGRISPIFKLLLGLRLQLLHLLLLLLVLSRQIILEILSPP